jgi:oligoribonuclease
MINKYKMIWLDLEMTGLDPHADHILEIATIVTDSELEVVAEGPVIAIAQDESILASMDEWNTKQHGHSGLLDRVRASQYTYEKAEQETLGFLMKWVGRSISPMCGNSICHDRRFLGRLMPELEGYFHYRNIDVSSIKELVRLWRPQLIRQIKKSGKHEAFEDIVESIEELKLYRKVLFDS